MSLDGDLPKGLALRSNRSMTILCILCLYGVVLGAGEAAAADRHVFVAGVGVVGRIGPGPLPRSPAWHAR